MVKNKNKKLVKLARGVLTVARYNVVHGGKNEEGNYKLRTQFHNLYSLPSRPSEEPSKKIN